MSHEQPSAANERKYPRWEMQMSWGDLLVATLERKTIPEDDLNYPTERVDFCRRQFQASNGDHIAVTGTVNDDKMSIWLVKVSPASSTNETTKIPATTFFISSRESDGESHGVYIQDGDVDFPVDSSIVESLFTKAASMVPITATEYELAPGRG